MMTHRSNFRPLIVAVALTAVTATIVNAPIDAQVVPAQTFTAAGTDASPQQSSNCNTGTLQVSGTGTWTIVPIGSNDNGLTYKTITTINSGSITSVGTFSGAVAGFAASYFSFNVTAVSGSVTIVKSCTSQVLPSSGGGGGGGNVVVTNGAGSPVPIYAPSAIPVTGSISANTVFPFPFNTASPQPGATAAGVGVLGLITGTTTVAPLTLSAANNLLTAINAPLPPGTNAIGSITNTSFGVSSLPSIPAGTNAIGSVTVSNFPPSPAPYATNASQQLVVAQATAIAVTLPASYQTAFPTPQPLQTDGSGGQTVSFDASAVLPAGTNVIGQVSINQTTLGTTNLVYSKLCDTTTSTTCATVYTPSAGSKSYNVPGLDAWAAMMSYNGATGGFAYNYGDLRTGSTSNGGGVAIMNPGGTLKTTLTSASATTCTAIESNTAGRLVAVQNAATTAQTVTLSLYDEGASPTCASADLVYAVILGASQVVALNTNLTAGLAYTLSAAATNNIVITRN